MKKLHIHIAVENLSDSIHFYSAMFGEAPGVVKEDYAKWALDEPSVNFSLSKRGRTPGLNHLGIQVDSEVELKAFESRLRKAKIATEQQEGASCCYAYSDKHWTIDPQGLSWELFHTLSSIPRYGEDTEERLKNAPSACCSP